MESEKKQHLSFVPFDNRQVKVDPICGIESSFIRMKFKEKYYSRPFVIPMYRNTLLMVLYYCKTRALIKLQHSCDVCCRVFNWHMVLHQLKLLFDDDEDLKLLCDDDQYFSNHTIRVKLFKLNSIYYKSKEKKDLPSREKYLLEEFNSIFLQSIRLYPKYGHRLTLDVFAAAVSLHIKSLYDLVLDDVVEICNNMTPEQILKTFNVGPRFYLDRFRSPRLFNWAFNINRTRKFDN